MLIRNNYRGAQTTWGEVARPLPSFTSEFWSLWKTFKARMMRAARCCWAEWGPAPALGTLAFPFPIHSSELLPFCAAFTQDTRMKLQGFSVARNMIFTILGWNFKWIFWNDQVWYFIVIAAIKWMLVVGYGLLSFSFWVFLPSLTFIQLLVMVPW